MKTKLRVFTCVVGIALGPHGAIAALTVTNPPAGSSTIAAGADFATEQIDNPWDMADAADVRLSGQLKTQQLTAPALGAGVFSATTNGNDPWFYAYFGGFISAVPASVEARHLIDTSRYRFLTARVRYRAAGGGVLGAAQAIVIYFLRDTSYSGGSFGNSQFINVPPDSWQIVTTDLNLGAPAWSSFTTIGSLRFDPATNPNVLFDVDWIRLTAPPVSAATSYTVTWTDTGSGPYTITAIDSGGARYTLASGVNASSVAADFSRLAPGDYQVEVARSGATAVGAGVVHINAPPLVTAQAPNIRGDQSRNYAQVTSGNPWGPMDAGDISSTVNLTNISYTSPAGSFSARPTNNDPTAFLNLHGINIDASLYRSLCFTEEVYGAQSVGTGSVTRLFWGNLNPLSTSDDFVVDEGTNEYCVADMAALTCEPASPCAWSGTIPKLRIDPHEFPVSAACGSSPSPANCRDFRIDSLVLSPFFTANPAFTFQWSLADTDTASVQMQVYLDPDLNPSNGNEILAGTTSAGAGSGQLSWYAPASVPTGRYNVRFVANDGANQNGIYADGPLLVASTAPADTIFRNGFE